MSQTTLRPWLVALLAAVLGTGGLAAEDSPYGTNPRLGGRVGRARSLITRSPIEAIEVPDVLTLKGGVKVEAYFLNIYGDRLVYYTRETERTWLRDEVAREDVEAIDFGTYLDRDPIAPRKIEPAKKQPVPKESILDGVFTARQGKAITWTLLFQCENDRTLDYAEDATEVGTFEFLSTGLLEADERRLPGKLLPRSGVWGPAGSQVPRVTTRAHESRSEGRYHLYAPGTVANEEWVLVLSGILLSETAHGRDTSISAGVVSDETLILYFSPEKGAFRLAWSNVGSWTWASIVGITFERVREAEPRPLERYEPAPAPGPDVIQPRSAPRPAPVRRPETGEPILASNEPAKKWGISGWGRPASRWGRR